LCESSGQEPDPTLALPCAQGRELVVHDLKAFLRSDRTGMCPLHDPCMAQDLTVINITFVKIDETRGVGANIGCCKRFFLDGRPCRQ
jgi:hypothetical protein